MYDNPMPAFRIRAVDYIIIAISIAVVSVLSVKIYTGREGASVVRITSADSEYIYPVDTDTEVEIEGPIGHTHVIIKEGSVFISESPCDNKLCILMGEISSPGQWIACMPNRVFVSIEGGGDEPEIDVLSY